MKREDLETRALYHTSSIAEVHENLREKGGKTSGKTYGKNAGKNRGKKREGSGKYGKKTYAFYMHFYDVKAVQFFPAFSPHPNIFSPYFFPHFSRIFSHMFSRSFPLKFWRTFWRTCPILLQ